MLCETSWNNYHTAFLFAETSCRKKADLKVEVDDMKGGRGLHGVFVGCGDFIATSKANNYLLSGICKKILLQIKKPTGISRKKNRSKVGSSKT